MRLNNKQAVACNYIKSSLGTSLQLDTGGFTTDEEVYTFINRLNEVGTNLKKEIGNQGDNTSLYKVIRFKDVESYRILSYLYIPYYLNVTKEHLGDNGVDLTVESKPIYKCMINEKLLEYNELDLKELLKWVEFYIVYFNGIKGNDLAQNLILQSLTQYLRLLEIQLRENNEG